MRIVTATDTSQHSDIDYQAMPVAARDAENAIINVLRYYEAPNALVFCNTRAMVNRLTTRFSNRGFSVVALSGELTQSERTHALQAMRDGRARVCIATDVAARGIDLPNLELVIHGELPSNSEVLLHRSGRTGRAGRKGVSVLIVAPKFRRKAELLLKGAKVEASWAEAPSAEAVIARDQERLLADPVWTEEVTEAEAAAAKRLTDLYDAGQIAAAYLRLFNARQSAPEELSPSGDTAPARPRAEFGASTWFSVAGGRKAGAEPRRLLPMLCKLGNITKDDIGAIRVQEDESFVEILSSSVSSFIASLGPAMAVDGGARVRRLDQTPDLSRPPRPAYAPKPAAPASRASEPRAEPRAEPRPAPPRAPAPAPERPAPVADAAPEPARRPAPPKVAPDRARNPSVRIEPPGGAAGPAADKPRKPRHKTSGRKPGAAPTGTPIGKPSSKKNRARALAARLAGDTKGGEAVPRRGKRKPPR